MNKGAVGVAGVLLAALLIFAAVWVWPDRSSGPQIQLQDFAFVPNELTVEVGTTVTWTNFDTVTHDVVFEEHDGGDHDQHESVGSGDLEQGDTWSYTFNEVGTFHYHCHPHPFMEGTIIVEGHDDEHGGH